MASVEIDSCEVANAVLEVLESAMEAQTLLREAMSNGLLDSKPSSVVFTSIRGFILENLSISVPAVPTKNGLEELLKMLNVARESVRLTSRLKWEMESVGWHDEEAKRRTTEWWASGRKSTPPAIPYEDRLAEFVTCRNTWRY